MRLQGTWLTLAFGLVVLVASGDAQTRRLRVRPRVLAAPSSAEYVDSAEDAQQDNRQYYAAPQRAQERLGDVVLVASSDEDYGGGQYGAPVAAARPRADQQQYQRPAAKSTTAAPVAARQKAPASESRAPPVQTIRNYSKVNDDGSFTFGYEAADGSFKEETRGTDCVVRGKYGYIDPDGNKREFTYVSGNPCDPNNPDGSEEEENDRAEGGQEDSNENVPQNYPVRRPVPVARPTPAAPVRHHSTPAPAPRPTTTVFQNDYQDRQRQEQQSADAEEEVQIGQRGSPPRPAARPFAGAVTTTQRPRVQIVSTTPSPTPTIFHSPAAPAAPQTVLPVNITPKPVYRVSPLPTQPTLAPTTYRPTSSPSTRGPTGSIDFEAEFKRFQADNKLPSPPTPSTAPSGGAPKPTGSPFGRPGPQLAAGNPIYQSQLIFDPASGQYDTALYQQLPQSDGDFQLNHRIQPYVAGPQQHQHQHHQPQPQQQQQQHPGAGQLVTLEQLQQQSPLYRAQPSPRPATVQIPQQLYQKQQNELQFINSQQLFAQQLELQQSQLRADRLEAAKKVTVGGPPMHRFQPQPQPQQQYYFIQPQGPPQGAPGQIDAFLRGHNIEY